MISPTQLNKPSNWQDFEKLCKLLWGEIWNCSDSIKRNGRQGQEQNGVDIYAYVESYRGFCGIQCKGKDDYTNAQLTEKEIDIEIEKALSFEPQLKLLLFATTSNKNARIEGYIRKKDIENRRKGLFCIDIASWEDIVDHLERYRTTYKWYLNNCQFIDATDISVTFDGEEEITIHPEYIKTTTHYIYKQISDSEREFKTQLRLLQNTKMDFGLPWTKPRKIDKRWCELNIRITNTGSTVIKSLKLSLYFRPEDIVKLDDEFYYCNTFGIDEAAKAHINANRDAKREVFLTYSNVIEFKPKDSVFVQEDEKFFSIKILAKDGIDELPMAWKFLCEDYRKEGVLMIIVEPSIIEKEETVEVYDESDVRPDQVEVKPYIIEN